MLIKKAPSIRPSEITDEHTYLNRRQFLQLAGFTAAGTLAGSLPGALAAEPGPAALVDVVKTDFGAGEKPNSYEDITTYNNFYEFGTGKGDPHRYAGGLVTKPWQVSISGACERPGEFAYEDIVAPHALEERIYRLRCVEAWSMVIPWVGFSLAELIKRFKPTSSAKFVKFTTLYDPMQMPGQRRAVLDWPYVEALTIAEAMNPLTLMTVGLYGRELPNQSGAPLRLVVPWKYGFKSIKSIVGIEFTEQRPISSWEAAAPSEYGFYANVNPKVNHPRWSQARERRIGAGVFAEKQPTLMFNGYTDEVAYLYQDLDLRRNF
ncbi:MAG: protein-methionine-sulfoxide reductase catalytic subunit MsrP [Gammaproteobacteria bacterium]